MKTLVLAEPERFELIDTPEPEAPGAGQALVRVRRIGVCGTDLHAFRGRQPFFDYPRILGHELGVEIVALGPDCGEHLAVGMRCAVEPYMNCGECHACQRGITNACEKLKVLGVHTDGGHRELIVVPANKLHPSASLSLEQLALVETLAIGAHAVRRAQIQPQEWVLVIGAGPIGLTVMQFAQIAQANVIVLDVDAPRLAFCQQHLGIEHTVQLGDNSIEQIRAIAGGNLPTIVFDATGNPASMQNAFNYLAHAGKLVYVGLFKGDVTFHDPDFHRREHMIIASRNATTGDMQFVMQQIEAGRINTDPWITHRASLAEAAGQFASWTDRATGVIKAVIELD
jgi:2-desacetyl-2-hydroxyethyl bacteriochlorophyllide A dehydrogenase